MAWKHTEASNGYHPGGSGEVEGLTFVFSEWVISPGRFTPPFSLLLSSGSPSSWLTSLADVCCLRRKHCLSDPDSSKGLRAPRAGVAAPHFSLCAPEDPEHTIHESRAVPAFPRAHSDFGHSLALSWKGFPKLPKLYESNFYTIRFIKMQLKAPTIYQATRYSDGDLSSEPGFNQYWLCSTKLLNLLELV